jgi:hypothetical protein
VFSNCILSGINNAFAGITTSAPGIKGDTKMRIGFILFIIISAIVGLIIKIATKRRMSRSLGREVGDHELTSLNSWMQVHEKEEKK